MRKHDLPPRWASRRQARIAAVQALFEADLAKHDYGHTLERVLEERYFDPEAAESDGHEAPPGDSSPQSGNSDSQSEDDAGHETALFARHLVHGVMANQEAIDREITRAAPAWPL